jgi:diguanylate cyclase (GGDEF)-like protein
VLPNKPEMDPAGTSYFDEQPNYGRWRTRARLTAFAFLAFASVGLVIHGPVLPRAGWLGWAMLLACGLGQLAAAALLWGSYKATPRRPTAALAGATLGASILAFVIVLTTPWQNDGGQAIIQLHGPTSQWLQALWRLTFGLTALGYIRLRTWELGGQQVPATAVRWFVAATTAFVVAALAATLLAGDHLPQLVADNVLSGTRRYGLLALVLAVSFAGCTALWRVRGLTRIDHAVALAALAIGLDAAIMLVDPRRYTAAYFIARLLDVVACSMLLVAATQRLVAGYRRLHRAVVVIDRVQHTAMRQSQRFAAVWRLVRDEHLDDRQRFQALLDAGAGTIRPDRGFFGEIGHLEGDVLVLDASSDTHAGEDRSTVGSRFALEGTRIPLAETLQYEIAQAGTTISFTDLNEIDHNIRRKRVHASPWNSMIGTTFTVGTTAYFVAFASTRSMTDDPFTDDDHAFVDVLASFLAIQLQQGRQLAQIRYQIEHDLLTDLPSRSTFRVAAMKNIANGVPCAIAIVALDRFREINDTYGHMIGDALLVEVGVALRDARESGDFLARLGGDNFAILIDDVRGGVDVETRLQPYREIFTHAFGTGDREGTEKLHLGASIGVALFPQDATSYDALLARADAAVDAAKQRQRGTVVYFNSGLQRAIEQRRGLHGQLADALARAQFTVRYQPTVELWTHRIVGAEALVRWQHPRDGLVLPDTFVPFAEQNGMIGAIGTFVMERVVADLAAAGPMHPDFRCYINLSGHQLGNLDFVAALREQLKAHPEVAGHLGIEITETVAMSAVDRTLEALAGLRRLGVVIALDDFGTGYSSLSHLKRLPIDVIKIDRSFVRGLPDDSHDAGLIETMIAIAGQFGFKTHAEGIETVEQFDWLRSRGCTYGQGFLIARPMPFTEFVPWLGRTTFTFVRTS